MERVVEVGGYDKSGNRKRLAAPRASIRVNVYGLSIDVFLFLPIRSR